MLDVLIAGAGPAGSVAGLILARAGARVLIVDRETFPRDKLCGDTLNPGAVARLESLGLGGGPIAAARRLGGMIVSGPHVQIAARYRDGLTGRAVLRRDLDMWLLDAAVRAGARFEPGLVVREPLFESYSGRTLVRGVRLESRQSPRRTLRIPASITIAADGRRSTLGRVLNLTRHPLDVRRWAFGVYATGVTGVTDLGEMHIRPGYYLGIAPITDTVANVCVVTGLRPEGHTPTEVIRHAIDRSPDLRARFERAEFVTRVQVLGPLAVETRAAGVDGLLLAGDAAGFVDPMTGDGIHLAVRGASLAADEALRILERGSLEGAPERLAEARRVALGGKQRFNRVLRRIVSSPAAVGAAEWGARLAPALLRRLVNVAGDAA